MSVLLLTTVSGNVILNDLKGYTYIHPTIDVDVYNRFTIEDIEKSVDFKDALDNGFITLKDDNGNSILDITSINTLQSYVYDKNNDGKIDADASNIESVNGQIGIVNINEPAFTGTTGIVGGGEGVVPDDGTVPTGSRALFDDGVWKTVSPGGGGDLISTNNLSDVSSSVTAFSNIKQSASATLTGVVELATQIEVDGGSDVNRVITPSTLAGSSLASDVSTNNSKVTNATHTGEVTGDTTLTITNNSVTNIKLADMNTLTIKGRISAGPGDPENLTTTQVKTMLDLVGTNSGDEPTFTGTTLSGLNKGLIPDDGVLNNSQRILYDDGTWNYLNYSNTLIVAKSGGQYTSITSALADSSIATVLEPITIKVMGGYYIESAMIIPQYVNLDISKGVYIKASQTTGNFITLSNYSGINGGIFYGPINGNNIYGINVNNVFIENITINSGDTGIFITGNSRILLETIIILGTINFGLVVENGGRIDSSNVLSNANTIIYANGGIIWIQNSAFENCINPLKADNSGIINAFNCNIVNSVNGLYTGLIGNNNIKANNISMLNVSNNLIQMNINSIIHSHNSIFDTRNFSILNWNNIRLNYSQDIEGDEGHVYASELNVGQIEKPSELSVGEGDSTERDMLVYTETDLGVLTDISVDAKSLNGNTFTFNNTIGNNSIYISTNLKQNSFFYQFNGIKVELNTFSVIGTGLIVWEFWNGSSWIEFNSSGYGANSPYIQSRVSDFSDTDVGSSIHIRFNSDIITDWVMNDPILEGNNRYWIKLKIKNSITTSPVFNQFKIHSNRMEINSDGWPEYFGKARPIGTLPWSVSQMIASNNSPANQDIYLSDKLSVGRIENNFENNTVDRSGFISALPQDLDNSSPIEFTWAWYSEGTSGGNIRWVVRWGYTNESFNVYNTTAQAPTTGVNEQEIILIDSAPLVANVLKYTTVKLDVNDCISRKTIGYGDLLWCSLERTGNNATDTNSNALVLVDLLPYYTKWCNGGHKIYLNYINLLNEDFESGSFNTNGWIVINDTTNTWNIGTAEFSTGINSAYISDDNGLTSNYNISTSNISHIYIDVVIPANASSSKLSFDWKCIAEDGPSDTQYDFGKVYIAPTTITPIAGTLLANTYLVGQIKYVNQTTWTGEELTISPTFKGTTARIIFTWSNDTSIGNAPGFCLDNIVAKYL